MIIIDTSYKRILWLILTDIKNKKYLYASVLLTCFGVLTFLFFNNSFSISSFLDLIFNPNQQVSYSSRTVTTFYYSSTGPIAQNLHFLKYHLEYFPKALFLTGFIITSLLFMEYGEITSRRFHIALPAMTVEKWISKLIISAVLFPILFLTIYQLFALITYQWGNSKGLEYVRLHFFDPYTWYYIRWYVVAQCFVFLGAVVFRKYSFFKLTLSALVLYFILIIVINLSMIILLPDLDIKYMDSYLNRTSHMSYILGNQMYVKQGLPTELMVTIKYVAIILGALGALFLSYLRFTELEA